MKRDSIETDSMSSTRFREKKNENQNTFIAKNVQKLKTFIQLLSKQLQTQDSMQT